MIGSKVERRVAQDMVDQMRWHRQLGPAKSMLKFRLPYQPGTTEYLDGELFLPVHRSSLNFATDTAS